MMNVVGDEDTEDEGSINSELTAVSNSSSGWTDSGGFPTPPFRFLAHNRAHEAEMDEVIHRFYDGLENSGENWQEYFDNVLENLPDASDHIDGVADSPFPGWETFTGTIFWTACIITRRPFWGVHPPETRNGATRQNGYGTSIPGDGTTLLVLLRKVKDWPFHDGICETLFLDGLGDYKIITSF